MPETFTFPSIVGPAVPGPAAAPVAAGPEQRMYADLNAVRRAAGLPTLTFDPRLARIAAEHAREMLQKNYVGHISPDGTTLADRLDRAAYPYEWAGENIAYAEDEPTAHSGLVSSPDHRSNMLQTNFGKVGIAAVQAWDGWMIFVQEFAD